MLDSVFSMTFSVAQQEGSMSDEAGGAHGWRKSESCCLTVDPLVLWLTCNFFFRYAPTDHSQEVSEFQRR